jgi:hypothetical protein
LILQINLTMINPVRIFKFNLIFIISAIMICTGCATTKQPGHWSKQEEALCDLSRLGKNKYYYSATYQRKLKKSEYKIGGKFTTYIRLQ